MKVYKKIFFAVLLTGFTIGTVSVSEAQDARGQAITLYNAGQELAGNGNFDEAVESYREALEIARENEIDDIAERASAQIPRTLLRRASQAYQTYQNSRSIEDIDLTIEYFKEAQEAAEEFGVDQIADQARGNIPQFYYLKAVQQFRNESFEGSLESLDRAIELNANYATAYYQKGIVLKRMYPGEVERWMEQYDKAIEVAERVGDNRTLGNARSGAAEELIFRAVTLAEQENYNRALELLERVENYDDSSADAHFRFAEIYNEIERWEDALRHANRSLELETGGVVDRAKIYFEQGRALKGLERTEAACTAFENANYGEFSDPASYELQYELRCEGHTSSNR